ASSTAGSQQSACSTRIGLCASTMRCAIPATISLYDRQGATTGATGTGGAGAALVASFAGAAPPFAESVAGAGAGLATAPPAVEGEAAAAAGSASERVRSTPFSGSTRTSDLCAIPKFLSTTSSLGEAHLCALDASAPARPDVGTASAEGRLSVA